jgi:hypothetical protein
MRVRNKYNKNLKCLLPDSLYSSPNFINGGDLKELVMGETCKHERNDGNKHKFLIGKYMEESTARKT